MCFSWDCQEERALWPCFVWCHGFPILPDEVNGHINASLYNSVDFQIALHTNTHTSNLENFGWYIYKLFFNFYNLPDDFDAYSAHFFISKQQKLNS